ncbi:hypothetical protein [Oleomonas cavernae]|uniref:hypothetical protein n=1 Tax=Oleomonas cavernae TaxID=2320859 RepID=UPI000E6CB3C6|nr:hypothetical protein [Oleomonas cavernae]
MKVRILRDLHCDGKLYEAGGKVIDLPDEIIAGLPDGVVELTDAGKGGPDPAKALVGSSVQPSHIDIGGAQVQLGTVVVRAHRDSGLTVDAWNGLPDDDRESRLDAAIVAMRAEAASKGSQKPGKRPGRGPDHGGQPVQGLHW